MHDRFISPFTIFMNSPSISSWVSITTEAFTSVNEISTSHDNTLHWRAYVLHIIVIENDSTVCQSIQVWSWNLL